MRNKHYQSTGGIKCDSCGNYHYQWWMILQTIGCASYMQLDFTGYQIVSTYGSAYDTLVFKVVKNRIFFSKHISAIDRLMNKIENGNKPIICDKCMERFIKRKYITDITQ